jgi:exopolysaccharide biosynthesis polyprenyl glycosylphosphotransferase
LNEAKRQLLMSSVKIFDLIALVFSFGLAMVTEAPRLGSFPLIEFLSMKVKLSNFITFVALLFIWHWIFALCGLYESKRLATRRSESIDVTKATAFVTFSLAVSAEILRMRVVTLGFFLVFWAFGTLAVITGRLAGRLLLANMRRKGRNLHYLAILGTNPRAIEFARKIEARAELGYRIVGFVDDRWSGTEDFLRTGFRLCCSLDELPAYLRDNVVDEVAIYLPLRSFYERASRLARLLEQHGLVIRFDSDILNLKIARPHTDVLDGAPQITAYCGGLEGWAMFVKWIIDRIGSLLLLVLLAPPMLIVALLVRVTSAGPIFFGQKRVGLNKRQFTMYKFRTMVPDAESMQQGLLHLNEMTGPVFKIKKDPRVTTLGRILRKTSIDELPQLFNVLAGDMSLVGPRAMSVRDYHLFSEDWQRRRFSVRPGITCLWQVNGRNSISFDQWMELDMQYIDKWSLWLDFRILALTVTAVMRGTGAA